MQIKIGWLEKMSFYLSKKMIIHKAITYTMA